MKYLKEYEEFINESYFDVIGDILYSIGTDDIQKGKTFNTYTSGEYNKRILKDSGWKSYLPIYLIAAPIVLAIGGFYIYKHIRKKAILYKLAKANPKLKTIFERISLMKDEEREEINYIIDELFDDPLANNYIDKIKNSKTLDDKKMFVSEFEKYILSKLKYKHRKKIEKMLY